MTRTQRATAALLTAVACAGGLTACDAEVDRSAAAPEISVTNCGVEQHYPAPERAVAYDVSAIEKMFSLGLADRMRGIVMPKTVSSVIPNSPYREDYGRVETVSDGVLGQEALVNAGADWAFAGWQAGFSQERGVTPESLRSIGISSYMQEETCYNYGEAASAGDADSTDPIEAMYRDLENLGDIFGVRDRADRLVEDLRGRSAALRERTSPEGDTRHRPRVFVYDSGTDQPYTAGRRAALNSVVEMAGGDSVTKDVDGRFTTVGWEPVVTAEPETILVIDYNKQPVEEKIRYLREESPLRTSPAVRNGRIRVIDYGQAVSSPRNIDAAEDLAGYLEEQRGDADE